MLDILKNYDFGQFSTISFQHLNIFNTRSRQRLPENSKTAIAFVFPYYNKSAFKGNISAYCSVEDYHIVVMKQLKSISEQLKQKYPEYSFEPFVDASPIDEVDMAAKAGLGVVGENSLLITEKWGSFVFIGEIITDMEMETVLYEKKSCMKCGLCKKNCPGGAINKGVVNTEKCASHISQMKRDITDEQFEILKRAKTVFGCDICQNVCPHNRNIEESGNLFSENIINTVTKEILEDRTYKQRAFGFRGLKVLERNLEIYNSLNE